MTHVEFLEKYLKYLEIISLDIAGVESAEAYNKGMQDSIKFVIELLKKPKDLEQSIRTINSVINFYEKGNK